MDDSDNTSADSSSTSDEIPESSSKQPTTNLPITTKNKNKNHKISIKNAFRRGRSANRALEDLKRLLSSSNPPNLTLWGIPLQSDQILIKFLRARDWRVRDAYEMISRTLVWRKKEMIDEIFTERIAVEAEKMVVCDCRDREGRPVCVSLYGELNDGEFYEEVFGDERKRDEFVRWRIRMLERVVKDGLDVIEVSDLKGLELRCLNELVPMGRKLLKVLHENYPDVVYRNIIINPPPWFHTVQGFLNQHCSAGTRKKFVVEKPNRITSRLLKYIEPRNIPIRYGGLKRENDQEFTQDDVNVYETVIKGGQQGKIEIPVVNVHVTIVWDVMVVGSEVVYKQEFVPDDEGSYKILLHKEDRIKETLRSSYYIREPGKIVITVKNSYLRKKRVFWRYKCKATLPAYVNNSIRNP